MYDAMWIFDNILDSALLSPKKIPSDKEIRIEIDKFWNKFKHDERK